MMIGLLCIAAQRAEVSPASIWLFTFVVVVEWGASWIDGTIPKLATTRKERPVEFAVIQIIGGLAICGWCYLVVVAF